MIQKKLYGFSIFPNLKDFFKRLSQIFILYLFLFQPPFISRTLYFFIEFIILAIVIIFNPKLFTGTLSKFKKEFQLLLVIILYVIFRDLLKGEQVFFLKTFLWIFQCFVFPVLIVGYYNEKRAHNFSYPSVISLLIWTILLGGVLSTLLLTLPPFYNLYQSLIIQEDIAYNTRIYRGYGVSENLTFTYSYLQGFIVGYSFLILNKRPWLLFFAPFLVIGVLFNARIGILPIILFGLLLIIKKGFVKKVILISSGVFIFLNVLPKFGFFEFFDKNKEWIGGFFTDILNLLKGSDTYDAGSSLEVLLTRFIIIPENLIFGKGVNLFLFNEGVNSDIGYINQLNYGGIVIIILLLLLVYKLIKRLIYFYGVTHWFTVSFVFSILILNFKGSIFVSTPGARFLFTTYIYLIIYALNNIKKNANYKEKNT